MKSKVTKKAILEFFIRGREITLPRGGKGIFLQWSGRSKLGGQVLVGGYEGPRKQFAYADLVRCNFGEEDQ